MKKETKKVVIVTHTMADGSICEDSRTYQYSPEQLSETTVRMMRMFLRKGYEILAEQKKQAAAAGE